MTGGLLNIISYGNQNIILNGNPSKTFFKTVYSKYTNFGIQKLRVDYDGQRTLKLNEDTIITFKLPRQADLILDTYLVMNMPDIWSTIIPPADYSDCWKPYEFKWVEHVGFNIIKKAKIMIGGQKIQEFTGEYLKNMVDRDYPTDKKDLVYKMIGHTVDMYDPANAFNRLNGYPNAFYIPPSTNIVGPEPSIRGKTLYIPLHFWFMNSPKFALPINCIQYADIQIELTLRPLYEIFVINDVSLSKTQGFQISTPIQPNPRNDLHSLYRFIQIPPSIQLNADDYGNKQVEWNHDLHLLVNYAFLTEEENRVFATKEHRYLVKDVKEDIYYDNAGSKRIKLSTNGLVSSWMWFFRRSDANLRNEWSNYTNWDYNTRLPYDTIPAPALSNLLVNGQYIGPGQDFTNVPSSQTSSSNTVYELVSTPYKITPIQNNGNLKTIMTQLGIIFDGKYREYNFDSGIYNLIEKYKCSNGYSNDGLYCYNFCLSTNPFDIQPSGAINLSKFKNIELEINVINPPIDPNAKASTITDSECQIIGVTAKNIYLYTYDLYFIEERYNVLRIIGGSAGMVFAR